MAWERPELLKYLEPRRLIISKKSPEFDSYKSSAQGDAAIFDDHAENPQISEIKFQG